VGGPGEGGDGDVWCVVGSSPLTGGGARVPAKASRREGWGKVGRREGVGEWGCEWAGREGGGEGVGGGGIAGRKEKGVKEKGGEQ
jgi:hypothetical protein